MKSYEKEILQHELDEEMKVLRKLAKLYKQSIKDIEENIVITDGKIKVFLTDVGNLSDEKLSELQSKVYQQKFQKELKKQLEVYLKALQENQYKTIQEYLNDCYNNGFIGVMYSLHKEGIPIILPIDQDAVLKAIEHDTNLSEKLYTKLGKDIEVLKKDIAGTISRGISLSNSYSIMAVQLDGYSKIGLNKAMRIVRTEGARITNTAAFDAMNRVRDEFGVDVKKKWLAALDARTRETHAKLDGEIREINEPFSNGMMHPLDPKGKAEEVINCRCRLSQQSKWALEEEATQYLGRTEDMTDEQLKPIADKAGITVTELRKYSRSIIPVKAKNQADFRRQYEKIMNYEMVE